MTNGSTAHIRMGLAVNTHFNLEECIGTFTAPICSGVGSCKAFSMITRYSSVKYLSESVGLLRSDSLTYTQSCSTSTLMVCVRCLTPLEQLCTFTRGLAGSMAVYRLSPVSKVMACLCHGQITHMRPCES